MFEEMKKFAIEQVIWAEKNLKDKSGAEKKAAVVKKLDDMITLPSYLEWIDDIIIGKLIDTVCENLNKIIGHDFGKTEIDEKQEKEITEKIDLSEVKNNGSPREI